MPSGGGNEFSNSDIPENWACETLDLVDVHSYSGLDVFQENGTAALEHAKAAKKLMMFEEFGSLGAKKAFDIGLYIGFFNQLGVPWSIWEICKPGTGATNYEFYVNETTYVVVQNGAFWAAETNAAQDFHQLELVGH